ncbi:DMT family transporter [Magnetospirillum moscoviense]|uniref:DMT family transporter n=1 Tax=Magnetospirillum moscoviense TaxID=1437059 RepID=UPI0012E70262|nr:DMT family transporter [Magnetospirillum moscoviense]MBF0324408.1 DMT family transporter [Alphaproteobacteria bacterium]
MTRRTRWLFLLVLPALFWAGNAVMARASVGDIPPVALNFWRWVLALALLAPFTLRDLWRHADIVRAHWHHLLAQGLVSVAAYNALLYLSLQTTTAINATLVGSSLPLMVLLLARLWLGEPIRGRALLGIVVSVAGVALVVTKGQPWRVAEVGLTPGDAIMLAATLSWALYSVMLKRFPVPLAPFTLLTALMIVGVVAAAPFYLWEAAMGASLELSARNLAVIAYTSVFASLAAYYFWNNGVVIVGAATAGQFTYLIPLFAAILGILLLGEEFRTFHAAGAALIFGGLFLAGRKKA